MAVKSIIKEILDWGAHILIAVLIGLFIVTFVAQRTIVNGSSMEPTLQDRDQLIIEKITPRFGKLSMGDIVTIYIPENLESGKDYIIKRVIGVEDDTVEIKDGKVYVNGSVIEENYINGRRTDAVNDQYNKIVVPKGHIYVLGDNRIPGASLDSRSIGPIDVKRVKGKAVVRFFPLGKAGTLTKK